MDGTPLALVTGVTHEIGIGAAIARRLESDGLRVATTGWPSYDDRMPWGADAEPLARPGLFFEADLEDPTGADALIPAVTAELGTISVLVLCHAESVDSDINTTTVESFDRHMAVNARATWLLIKAFADQFDGPPGTGRIIALTSDHTAGNPAYGASKGALDPIVLAAAVELAGLGITAMSSSPVPPTPGG